VQLVPRQNAVYSSEPREIAADVKIYSAQSKKQKYAQVLIHTETVKSERGISDDFGSLA
jgi:hypothetical protein